MYAELAQELIRIARPLYADEDLGLELYNAVFALDASTIDLCLSVFPWALFRSTKSGVKLHTLLDLRGSILTSSMFPMRHWATSTCSTCFCRSRAPSTSWTAPISISDASTRSTPAPDVVRDLLIA